MYPIINIIGFIQMPKGSSFPSLRSDLDDSQTHPSFYGCPQSLQE